MIKRFLFIFLFFISIFTQKSLAVSIVLDGTKTLLSGHQCQTAKYRFGTQSSYQGEDIDLILDVIAEDNDYSEGKCVDIVDNVMGFRLRDTDDKNNYAYLDVKVTVVKKGTEIPLNVDRITVTNFDLDNNPYYTDTDDVYYKNPSKVYLSEFTNVTKSIGNFFGNYSTKLKGQDSGNCNDNATLLQKECRAGVSFDNTSSFYARVQNDNAYGTLNGYPGAYRLIQFSFELKDLTPLMSEVEIPCKNSVNYSTSNNSWIEGDTHLTYNNNIDISKTIKVTDAQNLKLTINGETEKNFDWIYIYDENNNEIYVGSGAFHNKSIDLAGSEVTIRLTSDGSITKSGLTINLEGLGCQEEPTISLDDSIEITEGDSGDKELICMVNLDNPAPDDGVTVQVEPHNITANEGEDYSRVNSIIHFAKGESQKRVIYKIHGDTKVENNETFSIELLSPQNGKLDNNHTTAIATIINDDKETPELMVEYRFDECPLDLKGEIKDHTPHHYHHRVKNGFTTNGDKAQINRSGEFHRDKHQYTEGKNGLDNIFGVSSNQFTITAWVYPTSLTTAKTNHNTANTFFAKASDSENDNIEIGINSNGTLHLYLDTQQQDRYANFGEEGDISLNSWHFIGVSYRDGVVTVQIDDKSYENRTTWSGATNIDQAVGSPITIGASLHVDNYFDGYIDELKIFKNRLMAQTMNQFRERERNGKNWNNTVRDEVECKGASPIGCLMSAFMFQNRPTDINALNLANGEMVSVEADISLDNINAVGFNKKDGYFWGYNYTKQDGTITRIGVHSDGKWIAEDFKIDGLNGFKSYVGDIDNNAHLYLKESGNSRRVVVIDLDPNSSNYLKKIREFNLDFDLNIADWGFNARDNLLYAVNNGSGNKYLYKIDPSTGHKLSRDNTLLTGNRGFGASFFDANGFYYIYDNGSGNIYRIDVANSATAVLFATGEHVSLNDGAMCTDAEFKFDFGDLPNTYPTTLESNGARHSLPTYGEPTVYMGSGVSHENNGKPSAGANLDDKDDGVKLDRSLLQDKTVNAGSTFTLKITTHGVGFLNAWIDWNGDGDFNDENEKVATNIDGSSGLINLSITAPSSAVDRVTYARFRYSYQRDLEPTGNAIDGEVEDYRINIHGNLEPFSCTQKLYLSNRTELGTGGGDSGATWLHSFNAMTPIYTPIGDGFASGDGGYNAIGYNIKDNFIYALYGNELLKIDKNAHIKNLGVVNGLPEGQLYAGEFDRDGYYYVSGNGGNDNKMYKIDISQKRVISTITLSSSIRFWDMAIDTSNQYFYAMSIKDGDEESDFQNDKFIKINKNSGEITVIGDDFKDINSYISLIFTDNSGKVVLLANNGGMYELNPTTGVAYWINNSPELSYYNDGTSCPDATFTLPPHLPRLSIGDVTKAEGDNGESNFEFKISIDADLPIIPMGMPVMFFYRVIDGNGDEVTPPHGIATQSDHDFRGGSGIGVNMNIFLDKREATISVPVYGDENIEKDEEFFVDIYFPEFFPSNFCMLGKSRGVGTILNDDMKFTVIRSNADIDDKLIYTQIAGRDFDYSIVSNNPIENITIKVELINNSSGDVLYRGYKYIESGKRVDVKVDNDLSILTATKDASFKVSFLRDENGTIYHGDYANEASYSEIYNRAGYSEISQDASSHFTIRPAGYNIEIQDIDENNKTVLYRSSNYSGTIPLNLASEYEYKIEAKAISYDANHSTTVGYTTASGDINATFIFHDKSTCVDKSNIDIDNYIFNNGLMKNIISHNNVGNYILRLEDSKWSKLDREKGGCIANSSQISNSGDEKSGCNISTIAVDGYREIEINFHPYRFNIDSRVENYPISGKNYIYMGDLNSSLDMAINLKANITAVGKKNTVLTNFTKSCQATDIYLSLDYNITTDTIDNKSTYTQIDTVKGSSVGFKRVISFNGASFNPSDVESTHLDNNITISSDKFLDSNDGNTSISILYNLTKHLSEPINPIKISFNSLDINSTNVSKINNRDKSASGKKNIGVSKSLYYSRIAPDMENYPDEYEGASRTPISVLIYCKHTKLWCSNMIGDNGLNGVKTVNGWYRAILHDSNIDGKVINFILDNPLCEVNPKADKLPNFNEKKVGKILNITTGYSGNTFPAKVEVNMEVSPWLKYNRDPSRNGIPFWRNTFRDKNETWSGEGQAGNQIEIKTTTRPAKKIFW